MAKQAVRRTSKAATLTRRDLAKRLDVHMQTITKWEREGLPIASRGRKGRPSLYAIDAVKAWLTAREGSGAGSGSAFSRYQDAHARQRTALAELAELQLEERRGRLVDAQVMHAKLTDVFARCRTKLLGLPSKAKLGLPHLTHGDVLALDAMVREALEDLATIPMSVEAASCA